MVSLRIQIYYIIVKKEGWQVKRNPASQTEPYAFKNNQWVGFDDKASLKKKVS